MHYLLDNMCFEASIDGNDALKPNAVLIVKMRGIVFKTE
jgi:hypothetical protein